MFDLFRTPDSSLADIQVFTANSTIANQQFHVWRKPRGVSMLSILCHGGGGGGGNGVIGANSAAAAGSGGGSSGQSFVILPAVFIPDILYVSVGYGGAPVSTGIASRVATMPDTIVNNTVIVANGGVLGGSGSAGVAVAAGTGGAIATIALMPLAGLGVYSLLVGMAGTLGGAAIAATGMATPTSGLIVTGGTGGGGLPAAAAVGTAGGAFTVTVRFPPNIGGVGGTAATIPPTTGNNGLSQAIAGIQFGYGGTGGGSTHGSASGAGLVGALGGHGAPGCGGGGGGGALTGSTAGSTAGGRGGNGQVTIISW